MNFNGLIQRVGGEMRGMQAGSTPAARSLTMEMFMSLYRLVFRAAQGLIALFLALALGFGLSGQAFANPGVAYVGPALQYKNGYEGPPEGIRCVQEALGIPDDGQFGQQTYDAVRAFQSAHDLQVDGTVGPITGDNILAATSDDRRADCARWVPTTFYYMNDDGTLAEGGQVSAGSPTGPPATALDSGGAVGMGGNPVKCFVKAVSGAVPIGKLAKVLWNRKLPKPEDFKSAGNPFVAAAGAAACVLF